VTLQKRERGGESLLSRVDAISGDDTEPIHQIAFGQDKEHSNIHIETQQNNTQQTNTQQNNTQQISTQQNSTQQNNNQQNNTQQNNTQKNNTQQKTPRQNNTPLNYHPKLESLPDTSMCRENRTDFSVLATKNISEQVTLDAETIRKHQKEDLILSKVAEWLHKGERPKSIQAIRAPPDLIRYWRMFDQLTLKNDIVYKKWITCRENEEGLLESDCMKQLIIIPETLREQVMNITHGTIANLHPGIDESVRRCQMYYYWAGMKEDFGLFVAACTVCGTSKQPVKYLRAPLKHIVVSDFNMCLVLDHIVPERDIATPRKMRYILSITDMFSGYVIAKPTKTQEAVESYRIIMREWVLRYGFPQEIIFDNAPGFKSEFFQLAFKSFGCKMTPGLPYSCSSTAKAERTNKRINTALRVTLSEEQVRDWDLYLDYVTYGLNSMKSRHTGVSANMIVFGREIRTPLSLTVENEDPDLGPFKNKSHAEVARLKHQLIKTIIRKARVHAQKDFMYADNTYNRNIEGPFFETGDYCYVLVDCPKHKFSKRWKGPYRITKAVNQHLYLVRLETGDKMCSITKMKKYKHNIFSPMSNDSDATQSMARNEDVTDLSLIPNMVDEHQSSRPKRASKPPERFVAG
jgi:hypothetical protein